jgi:F-box/leucine-rich repeat protein 2/20
MYDDNNNLCIYLFLKKKLKSITDDAVQKLAQNCPNIHYLCVSGCANLTDTSLMALAQHCHKLSTFEVAGCSQFTDGGFQALARV